MLRPRYCHSCGEIGPLPTECHAVCSACRVEDPHGVRRLCWSDPYRLRACVANPMWVAVERALRAHARRGTILLVEEILRTVVCEFCGANDEVTVVSAMTAYEVSPLDVSFRRAGAERPKDPNAALLLCNGCSTDYRDHWEGMWRDYYASIM